MKRLWLWLWLAVLLPVAAQGAGHYVGSTSTGSGGTIPPSTAAANTFWAGPASGGAGAPSFRAITLGDVPPLPDTGIFLTTPLLGQTNLQAWETIVSTAASYSLVQTANQISITQGVSTYTFALSPPFIVNNNSASAPAAPTGNAFQYVTQDSANGTWDIDVFGASPRYLGRAWGGTNASPTAVGAAIVDGGVAGRAYDGTSMPTVDEGAFQTITTQVQTATHHGHGCEIVTTANNTTSSHQAVTCYSTGGIALNDSSGTSPTGGDPGAGGINMMVPPQVLGNSVTGSTSTGGATLAAAQTDVFTYRAEDRMLMMVQSSGSIGNNGAVTLTTAIPTGTCSSARGGCYMSYPAGSIATGVPAADTWYYTTCSSTTACTAFNNTYTAPGVPLAPGSPTAFVTTGPGVYTQTTTALTAMQLTIPANSMGTSGRMDLTAVTITDNSATNKTTRFNLGGTLFAQFTATTSVAAYETMSIWNNSTGIQTASSYVLGQSTTAAATYGTVDTTTNLTMTISLVTNVGTEFVGVQVANVEVVQ